MKMEGIMKNRFTAIYASAAAAIFILSMALFGYSIGSEYSRGEERTARRFEHLRDTLAATYSGGKPERISAAAGNLDDFAFLRVTENGTVVFLYPPEGAGVQESEMTSARTAEFAADGRNCTVTAALYRLRPATVFRAARSAFIAIAAVTAVTVLILVYLYSKERAYLPSGAGQGGTDDEPAPEDDDMQDDEDMKQDERERESQPDTDENTAQRQEKDTADAYSGTSDVLSQNTADPDPDGDDGVIPPQASDDVIPAELPVQDLIPAELSGEDGAPEGKTYSAQTGIGREEHLMTRLESELNRSIASETDLSLFIIKISGTDRSGDAGKSAAAYLTEQFRFRDLIFEYRSDRIAGIRIGMTVDEALVFADRIYAGLEEILEPYGGDCRIGISARAVRMISGERLLLEAAEALEHAEKDDDSPITAFRANAEKYRQFVGES